jgi:hypothetical protein
MSCDEELDLDRLARDSLHFRRRVVELAADEELRIDATAWRDAIVFLDTGEVELECVIGERRRFSKGAVLCLVPPVRVLRNCGADRARLIAISRRARNLPRRAG